MTDPLEFLAEKCPYDAGKILASVKGDMYFGVMLANGQIGVSSTLGITLESDPQMITKIDLNRQDHRVFQLAYSNAVLNYEQEYTLAGDIFDRVQFSRSQPTVMIGYFPPLVEKFKSEGLPLKAFDLQKENEDLSPAAELPSAILDACQVIISATSLINKSLSDILANSKTKTELYLLGPSTPLNGQMKDAFGFTSLFGMIFDPYEFAVLELIGQGLGTQSFSSKGKKVQL
jgi:uncharacterized protein (DUF4213/DUF364 family)